MHTTLQHISKNEYHKLLFGDESGEFFVDRFWVLAVVRFNSFADFKKFSTIVQDTTQRHTSLRQEIKSAKMSYEMRVKLFKEIHHKIKFNVWFNVVDMHDYNNKQYLVRIKKLHINRQ